MKPNDRLAVARWEADRHAAALSEALADQILFRFTKLQGELGERLVPATLQQLAEPFEDWPMRDRLERLEKLGYMSVDNWMRWRELRNPVLRMSIPISLSCALPC
jgi:hypothetical protein